MHNVLVVEDWGARTDAVVQAAKDLGGNVQVSVETGVDWLGAHALKRLAQYDSFLVDFDLSMSRPGAKRMRGAVTFNGEPLDISTGMGVMLFLRLAMARAEYQQERDELTAGRPADQRKATIYSFVDLDEIQSMFFASAAAAWLGASFFKAVPDAKVLSQTLGNPAAAAAIAEAQVVDQAQAEFMSLMDWASGRPPFKDLQPEGQPLETYDFLSTFHKTYGSARTLVGKEAAAKHLEALAEVSGVMWQPTNATSQYQRELGLVQEEIRDFLDEFGNNLFYDRLGKPFREEPHVLEEVLRNSHLFWTSPDVRAALRWHRRHGAAGAGARP
jgi:hypothetical protein